MANPAFQSSDLDDTGVAIGIAVVSVGKREFYLEKVPKQDADKQYRHLAASVMHPSSTVNVANGDVDGGW